MPFSPRLLAAVWSTVCLAAQSPLPTDLANRAATLPRALLVDQDDGAIVVVGDDYKAEFRDGAVHFRARTGPAAPSTPIRLQLAGAAVGGIALPLPTGPFVADGARCERHGRACSERYDASANGLEQSFVFPTLPQRGDLVVDVAVHTALTVRAAAGALHFTDAHVHVVCDRAFAVDARGARCDLALEWRGDGYRLRVPAAFVATAELPLVVDPIVASTAIATGTAPDTVDVVWSPSAQHYVVVYDDAFASGDRDLYARTVAPGGVFVGLVVIDASTASTTDPAIAYDLASDRLLVVYEQGGTIRGRLLVGSGLAAAGATFEISGPQTTGQTNLLEPDVGGNDVAGTLGNAFQVAWTRIVASPMLSARQVAGTGALFALTNSGLPQLRAPSVSQSRRGADHWLVVAMNEHTITDSDLYALRADAAQNVFVSAAPIETSPRNTRLPDVSPPNFDANGTAHYFVACHYQTPSLNLLGVAVTVANGTIAAVAGFDLTMLENVGPAIGAGIQAYPKVSSDGQTFCVAYEELAIGSSDFVCYGTILQENNGLLRVVAPRQPLGSFGGSQRHVGLAADPTHHRYAAGLATTIPGTLPLVLLTQLEATELGVRLTGCDGLWTDHQGQAVPGSTVTFTLPAGTLGGFAVGQPTAAAPLAGCSCLLAVAPIALVPNPFPLAIPADLALVGATLSVQGFDLGVATCLGALRLSNTLDLTVR